MNQDTGKVTLQFSTFDRLCEGYYYFTLEAFENVTEDKCNGTVFGHSYVMKDICGGVNASHHSERKGGIKKRDQCNETCPHCEKVTELLYINYGLDSIFFNVQYLYSGSILTVVGKRRRNTHCSWLKFNMT